MKLGFPTGPRPLRFVLGLAFVATVPSLRVHATRASRLGDTVTFERASWSAGERVESKTKTTRAIDFVATVSGDEVGQFSHQGDETVEKRIEILALEEGEPSRIRVHYEEFAQTTQESDEAEAEPAEPSPLDGRTFLLERRDGEVIIQDDEGETVDKDVEDLIREEEVTEDGRLEVGVDQVAELVAESPRTIGERIEVPEELALEIFGKREPPEKIAMSLELREVREIDGVACGVFETEIEIEGAEDGLDVETRLAGETWITIETGRYFGGSLTGGIEISGEVTADEGSVELRGEGTLAFSESREYTRGK